ncbi:hypothetical protein IWQ60_001724 [Tieghemiomyces parasiticus]|uniref:RGS domain-containing protein n=1 Tax=Tieghemiomyces parasiticus TaxID=78921 RepID=A0A9W8ACK9_9FUNG|nr:hypothetical protein IWQ60_001724 [Tieghemiomyces parasiticus]
MASLTHFKRQHWTHLDDAHPPDTVRRAIVYPIIGVIILIAAALTVCFAYRGRHDPFFQYRSVSLTILGVVASIFSLACAMVFFVENKECWLLILVNVLTIHVVFFAPILCACKLWALAKHAQALQRHMDLGQEVPDGDFSAVETTMGDRPSEGSTAPMFPRSCSPTGSRPYRVDPLGSPRQSRPGQAIPRFIREARRHTSQRPWYLVSHRTLRLKLLTAVLVLAVYSGALYAVFISTTNEGDQHRQRPLCSRSWLAIYNTVVVGVEFLVVYPLILYYLRPLQDGFAIRQELLLFWIVITVVEIAYRILFNLKLYSWGYIVVQFVLNTFQCVWYIVIFVVVPLVKHHRERHRERYQVVDLPVTATTLYQLLADPERWFAFVQFCSDHFCGELPSFLMDYQRLKVRLYRFADPFGTDTFRSGLLEPEEYHGGALETEDRGPDPSPLQTSAHVYDDIVGDYGARRPSTNQAVPAQLIGGHYLGGPVGPAVAGAASLPTSVFASGRPTATTTTVSPTCLAAGHLSPTNPERAHWATLVTIMPYPASLRDVWTCGSPNDPAPVELQKYYRQFYRKYFTSRSLFEINIDNAKKRLIQDRVAQTHSFTVGVFDAAKDAVVDLLVSDMLGRFKADGGFEGYCG